MKRIYLTLLLAIASFLTMGQTVLKARAIDRDAYRTNKPMNQQQKRTSTIPSIGDPIPITLRIDSMFIGTYKYNLSSPVLTEVLKDGSIKKTYKAEGLVVMHYLRKKGVLDPTQNILVIRYRTNSNSRFIPSVREGDFVLE